MDLSAIVLAGGESKRLGRDKAAEMLGSERLIDHVLGRLIPLTNKIIVVTAPGKMLSCAQQIKIVFDIYPGQGPLGGIYTGLKVSSSDYNLVVACDLPFLNQNLLGYLLSLAPNYQAVVPRTNGLEPLVAVYSRTCLPAIEELLGQGRRQVIELFPRIIVRYVEPGELEKFDPQYLSFFNINTAEDLAKAQAIFHSLGEAPGK